VLVVAGRNGYARLGASRIARDLTSIRVTAIVPPPDTTKNPYARFGVAPFIDFELCNNGRKATKAIAFAVSGGYDGHSNEYRIDTTRFDYRDPGRAHTTFNSDRIVAPATCDTVTYWSAFTRYDRYTARAVGVEWMPAGR
jgi:hypothetical protein